jgi:hypothetical protein
MPWPSALHVVATTFRIDEMRTADAIRMGLEQAIAQQLLGMRLAAQLERCSFLEQFPGSSQLGSEPQEVVFTMQSS